MKKVDEPKKDASADSDEKREDEEGLTEENASEIVSNECNEGDPSALDNDSDATEIDALKLEIKALKMSCCAVGLKLRIREKELRRT